MDNWSGIEQGPRFFFSVRAGGCQPEEALQMSWGDCGRLWPSVRENICLGKAPNWDINKPFQRRVETKEKTKPEAGSQVKTSRPANTYKRAQPAII